MLDLLPVELRGEAVLGRAAAAARGARFCTGIIDAVAPYVVAVKPQVAFFEALGRDGWRALEHVCAYAREAGLLVIADAKRGDVGSTARAYAAAFLEPRDAEPPLADALTVKPVPRTRLARPVLRGVPARGRGGLPPRPHVEPGRGGAPGRVALRRPPLWRQVAELVDQWGEDLVGERGLSSVGAVVGATCRVIVGEARRDDAAAIILLPGVGAQGATPADVARAFTSGPSSALVNASRSIIYAFRDAPAGRLARRRRGRGRAPAGGRLGGGRLVTASARLPGRVKRWGLAAVAIAALALSGPVWASAPPVQAQAYVVQSSVDGRTLAARSADTPPADGQHHEAHDGARRPRPPPARPRRDGARGGGAGRRVVARPPRGPAASPSATSSIGALVPSANDAATALAIAAGAARVPRFVALMNRKARELGLSGTRYRNPHGLDEAGHVSTARDVATLLRVALRNPVIRRYAGSARATLSDGRVVVVDRQPDRRRAGDRRRQDRAHLQRRLVAGRVRAGPRRRDHRRRPRRARRGAARPRPRGPAPLRASASYRQSKVVDPRRTYAPVPVGWGLDPVRLVAPRAIVRPAPLDRPLVERVVGPAVARFPSARASASGRWS